ncbi:uncharacterized protein BDR25DRAFT_356397 [Lindgomyces ingoldianus]|uniref:Uncharacterized protein n=1 Tax=Lindgomyces ingoldianus TaxID=673940 RepID=A0ACB6QUA2_9PLEO|nr:uncharacterized protein BDR25DRAFT_356397 [Lindgomyces ingoldianus]KAF2469655.1 hypothetical protein BDR25DRAFT_356397 [Lindgomyces ingoldianus]
MHNCRFQPGSSVVHIHSNTTNLWHVSAAIVATITNPTRPYDAAEALGRRPPDSSLNFNSVAQDYQMQYHSTTRLNHIIGSCHNVSNISSTLPATKHVLEPASGLSKLKSNQYLQQSNLSVCSELQLSHRMSSHGPSIRPPFIAAFARDLSLQKQEKKRCLQKQSRARSASFKSTQRASSWLNRSTCPTATDVLTVVAHTTLRPSCCRRFPLALEPLEGLTSDERRHGKLLLGSCPQSLALSRSAMQIETRPDFPQHEELSKMLPLEEFRTNEAVPLTLVSLLLYLVTFCPRRSVIEALAASPRNTYSFQDPHSTMRWSQHRRRFVGRQFRKRSPEHSDSPTASRQISDRYAEDVLHFRHIRLADRRTAHPHTPPPRSKILVDPMVPIWINNPGDVGRLHNARPSIVIPLIVLRARYTPLGFHYRRPVEQGTSIPLHRTIPVIAEYYKFLSKTNLTRIVIGTLTQVSRHTAHLPQPAPSLAPTTEKCNFTMVLDRFVVVPSSPRVSHMLCLEAIIPRQASIRFALCGTEIDLFRMVSRHVCRPPLASGHTQASPKILLNSSLPILSLQSMYFLSNNISSLLITVTRSFPKIDTSPPPTRPNPRLDTGYPRPRNRPENKHLPLQEQPLSPRAIVKTLASSLGTQSSLWLRYPLLFHDGEKLAHCQRTVGIAAIAIAIVLIPGASNANFATIKTTSADTFSRQTGW